MPMFAPQPDTDLLIPLAPGRTVSASLPPKMTEEEWQQLWHVLAAMKPGIVIAPMPAVVAEVEPDGR